MATFYTDLLAIDCTAASSFIEKRIQDIVLASLRRRGAVVGLSGGVDSSVTAALCVRALGKERVFGILMPEYESADDSLQLGRKVADYLGIDHVVEEIGPCLESVRCYQRRDDAIRKIIPEYRKSWKSKIVLPDLVSSNNYALFWIVAESPSGERRRARLSSEAYRTIVAATNFKQRTRKMMEYYHADRLWFAVAGTPNRLEYAQGFFVKNGDGAADFKPIAHLYKSQVYQLGHYLGIPEEILRRPPTTDTYTLEQTQEEFYFALPLEQMDLCLYAKNHSIPSAEVAKAIGLNKDQVDRVFNMIESKVRASKYLHLSPQLVEDVEEVSR